MKMREDCDRIAKHSDFDIERSPNRRTTCLRKSSANMCPGIGKEKSVGPVDCTEP
jgi:hypothetical protein